MAKITVLGAGGWGLAIALTLHFNGHKVAVWSPFKEEVETLLKTRANEKLLSGVIVPQDIVITDDITDSSNSAVTVIATPSFAVRQTASRLKEVGNLGIVVNVAKGFEPDTNVRLSQAIKQELPDAKVAVLSGPSHAEEVARRIPTMLTVSGDDTHSLRTVQELFSNDFLRVYTNPDIIGVELGGALKNIIAVAAGVLDGMGLGDNSKAALITRGLAEMTRLGVVLGAKAQTFAGLAGMGDLIVTCTSPHSRNHRFGEFIGKGMPTDDAIKAVGTVEGYYACKIANNIAKSVQVEVPIIDLCYQLLYEGYPVSDAVKTLMTRPFKEE